MIQKTTTKCRLNKQALFIKSTLVLFLALSLTSCPSQRDPVGVNSNASSVIQEESLINHGGADPSGGEGTKSSEQDLLRATKYALVDITDIFHRLAKFENSYHDGHYDIVRHIKPCLENKNRQCLQTFKQASLQLIEKFDWKKIYKKDTSCPQVLTDHASADMSITKELDLCISSNLLRYPPKELKVQTYALIAHEIAHAVGLEEVEAKSIQDFLLDYSSLSYIDRIFFRDLRKLGKLVGLNIAKLSHYLVEGNVSSNLCYELGDIYFLHSRFQKKFSNSGPMVIEFPFQFVQNEMQEVTEILNKISRQCKTDNLDLIGVDDRLSLIAQLREAFLLYFKAYQKVENFILPRFVLLEPAVSSWGYFLFELAASSYSSDNYLKNESLAAESVSCETYVDGTLIQKKDAILSNEKNFEIKDRVLEHYQGSYREIQVNENWVSKEGVKKLNMSPLSIATFRKNGRGSLGVELKFDGFFSSRHREYFSFFEFQVEDTNAEFRFQDGPQDLQSTHFLKVLNVPGDSIEVEFYLNFESELFESMSDKLFKIRCVAKRSPVSREDN